MNVGVSPGEGLAGTTGYRRGGPIIAAAARATLTRHYPRTCTQGLSTSPLIPAGVLGIRPEVGPALWPGFWAAAVVSAGVDRAFVRGRPGIHAAIAGQVFAGVAAPIRLRVLFEDPHRAANVAVPV